MNHRVRLAGCDESYLCKSEENVLQGMLRLGKKGIPSGCHGGGCGICKVAVLDGEYTHKKMSKCHISEEDLENDIVLACRVYPKSDLDLDVIGLMKKCVNKPT